MYNLTYEDRAVWNGRRVTPGRDHDWAAGSDTENDDNEGENLVTGIIKDE